MKKSIKEAIRQTKTITDLIDAPLPFNDPKINKRIFERIKAMK